MTGRGARYFEADQVLIVTQAAGAVLPNPADDKGGKLYVVRITGQDYDLHHDGAENYMRLVALAFTGEEMVTLVRKMIGMLCDAGDEGLIVADILRDMRDG